jgi:antitoxin component HigA of HigAB toxin-antitoxin module
VQRLSKIFEADADSTEGMEVELLITWIDKYKKEQNPIALSDPIDATRETMESKGFKDKLDSSNWQ